MDLLERGEGVLGQGLRQCDYSWASWPASQFDWFFRELRAVSIAPNCRVSISLRFASRRSQAAMRSVMSLTSESWPSASLTSEPVALSDADRATPSSRPAIPLAATSSPVPATPVSYTHLTLPTKA